MEPARAHRAPPSSDRRNEVSRVRLVDAAVRRRHSNGRAAQAARATVGDVAFVRPLAATTVTDAATYAFPTAAAGPGCCRGARLDALYRGCPAFWLWLFFGLRSRRAPLVRSWPKRGLPGSK